MVLQSAGSWSWCIQEQEGQTLAMEGYFQRQSWFWLKPWLLRISFSCRLHCSAHTCAAPCTLSVRYPCASGLLLTGCLQSMCGLQKQACSSDSAKQGCALTWDPVSMELRRAPVWVFQNLMLRSAVPPPEASRLAWKGHQASAFTAAVCAVILCMGGPPADVVSCYSEWIVRQRSSACLKLMHVCGGVCWQVNYAD